MFLLGSITLVYAHSGNSFGLGSFSTFPPLILSFVTDQGYFQKENEEAETYAVDYLFPVTDQNTASPHTLL